MHFNRAGIEKIYEAVEAGVMDAIVVKDLSRLGRHRTQTALFIDFLRENHIRVLSATEGIDTFNENDDLIIGFKGLVNDFYARDGSRRVRTGYRQKQKAGIVITPPFGYFKDKNTNRVEIVPEAAETIRLIYNRYLEGMGLKAIARMLNEGQYKTPALMQKVLLGKRMPKKQEENIRKKYLWDATMVSRILQDEAYAGTLICHKSERNKINKTFRFTEASEQFRHENFLPAIIPKTAWEQAQVLLEQRKKGNVRAGPEQPILRYSGLIACGNCGRAFTGKRTKLKTSEYVSYICSTYLRHGKEHCGSHAIREEYLDEVIRQELLNTRNQYHRLWHSIENSIGHWMPKETDTAAQIRKQEKQIELLEEETEVILMERIRDKANAERYDRMIAKREEQITQARKRIAELENIGQVLKTRQAKLKKDISLMDKMYERNQEYLKELTMYILAGKIKIEQLRNVELPEIQNKARQSGLPEDAQAANDFANMIGRFEKKIHDLELTRTISIQMSPQIRMIQNNDTLMAEKIRSSIVNTIPLWKSQMVMALSLHHSEQAMKAQREVTDVTNELLTKNAQALHQGSVSIAREAERGIVDMETLKKTNQELIATLDEVRQIQDDGRARRAQAEEELGRIEGELKQKLLDMKG